MFFSGAALFSAPEIGDTGATAQFATRFLWLCMDAEEFRRIFRICPREFEARVSKAANGEQGDGVPGLSALSVPLRRMTRFSRRARLAGLLLPRLRSLVRGGETAKP